MLKNIEDKIIIVYFLASFFCCYVVLSAAFDQLHQLIHIAITLQVTSASTEIFFSALKRVKTYMSGTMGGKRFSNLLVICTETNCVKKLNFNALVDKFGRGKSRRYPVLLRIGLILVYFHKRIWNCWNIILYWDNVIQIRVNVYKRPSNKWMLWIFLLIFDSVKMGRAMATPDGNLKWRPCSND